MKLDNFNAEDFLANYWQQQACVIKQAFAEPFWLEPDELAGLALEDEIESRLIRQIKKQWQVEHGPFTDQTFQDLGNRDWTLLVQGVDQWVPEVRALLSAFGFLPSWRLDDVMVSFAPKGGTVSQHFDYYDVFLIQGEGRRHWQVGQVCDASSELLADSSVKILKDFHPFMDVVLEPGDVLYIPARHAHLGVSLENSMTYSVGFRAPSMADMLDSLAHTASDILEDQRYQDTAQTLLAAPGEIPAVSIELIRKQMQQLLLDDALLQRCLGRLVTEPKYPDINIGYACPDQVLEQVSLEALLADAVLYKNPHSRFAYSTQNQAALLFADGECYSCSIVLARYLANHEGGEYQAVQEAITNNGDEELLWVLLKAGLVSLEPFEPQVLGS